MVLKSHNFGGNNIIKDVLMGVCDIPDSFSFVSKDNHTNDRTPKKYDDDISLNKKRLRDDDESNDSPFAFVNKKKTPLNDIKTNGIPKLKQNTFEYYYYPSAERKFKIAERQLQIANDIVDIKKQKDIEDNLIRVDLHYKQFQAKSDDDCAIGVGIGDQDDSKNDMERVKQILRRQQQDDIDKQLEKQEPILLSSSSYS